MYIHKPIKKCLLRTKERGLQRQQ